MQLRFIPRKLYPALMSVVTTSVIASDRISILEPQTQFQTPVTQLSVAYGDTEIAGVSATSNVDREAANRILFQSGWNLYAVNRDTEIAPITVNRSAVDPNSVVSVSDSSPFSISANGKWVAFSNSNRNTSAQYGPSTFVPNEIDNNGRAFVRNLETDELVQIAGSHKLGKPALSANGECVVFSNNSAREIQVAKIGTISDLNSPETIEIIARIPASGWNDVNRRHFGITGDCSEVIYRTNEAKDTVKDGYGSSDIYAYNISTGNDELITTDSDGAKLFTPAQGNTVNSASMTFPSFTAYGNLVAFEGAGTNQETGESIKKVYVKNRLTGELRDLSESSNGFSGLCEGTLASVCNVSPSIDPTGEYIAFYTAALVNSDMDATGDSSTTYTVAIHKYSSDEVIRSDSLTSSHSAIGNVNLDLITIGADGVFYATDSAIDTLDTNRKVDVYYDENPWIQAP